MAGRGGRTMITEDIHLPGPEMHRDHGPPPSLAPACRISHDREGFQNAGGAKPFTIMESLTPTHSRAVHVMIIRRAHSWLGQALRTCGAPPGWRICRAHDGSAFMITHHFRCWGHGNDA
jgi:hypothetical protein